jgi:hypothetical protein
MALVRAEVSEELSACFIRVTRIGELGATLAVTSNQRRFLQEPHGVISLQTPFLIYIYFECGREMLLRNTGEDLSYEMTSHVSRQ